MTQSKTTDKTETLKEKVVSLIKEIDATHRYSMSRIYGLYNEVFSVAEAPQSCASCLIRKVNQLKTWLSDQPDEEALGSNEGAKLPQKMRGRKAKQSN